MKTRLLVTCTALFSCASVNALAITTDLDADATFGSNGSITADFSDGNGNSTDVGLRTFTTCVKAGTVCAFPVVTIHYLVGVHADSGHVDALIELVDNDGNPVPSFGASGKKTVQTNMTEAYDVAFDPATLRLYFAGAQRLFSTTSKEFAVTCIDTVSGAPCGGFGNAALGAQLVPFDLGGSNTDIATRVVLDAPSGALYVAGTPDGPTGYQIAVAKMSMANGAPIITFGNLGHANFPIGDRASGNGSAVLGMALSDSGLLYLAGKYLRPAPANNYDGYAFVMNAATGGSTFLRTITLPNNVPGFIQDIEVGAITVLANGKLAMAGDETLRGSVNHQLLLAKTDSALTLDTGFCGTGICAKPVGSGTHGWQNTTPTAIAERPNNRDLVVGMQAGTYTFNVVTSQWILSQKQVVQQYAASGGALHAEQQMGFPVVPGFTRAAYSYGMTVDNHAVELTGTYQWDTSGNDMDLTTTRLLANDTIFANQFGGANSD